MKKEIELKFFVGDLAPIRKKLKKLGAKLEWAGSEYDRFFDTPDRRLQKKNAILRLRVTPDFSYLTYKEKVAHKKFKVANEYQVDDVKEPEELRKIFERLGFRIKFAYKKPKREFWRWGKNLITFDSYPFGKFIEVEGSEKFIRIVARKLDLDFARSSRKSYTQLLREYKNKPR